MICYYLIIKLFFCETKVCVLCTFNCHRNRTYPTNIPNYRVVVGSALAHFYLFHLIRIIYKIISSVQQYLYLHISIIQLIKTFTSIITFNCKIICAFTLYTIGLTPLCPLSGWKWAILYRNWIVYMKQVRCYVHEIWVYYIYYIWREMYYTTSIKCTYN